MKTYIKTYSTFSDFDFNSKYYAGLASFESYNKIVANIQPVYATDGPVNVMILVAKDANGNGWSPSCSDVMIPVSQLQNFIDRKLSNFDFFEFDTAKEKFTWLAQNL